MTNVNISTFYIMKVPKFSKIPVFNNIFSSFFELQIWKSSGTLSFWAKFPLSFCGLEFFSP